MSYLLIRVFNVEHGACTMIHSPDGERLAMIDSGHNTTSGWRPSTWIKSQLKRATLDYLFVTNADQDHLSDLEGLWEEGVSVTTLIRNRSISAADLRAIKEEQGECTNDIERYLKIHGTYTHPVAMPFDQAMGGATFTSFCHSFPTFQDTNNLSFVVFLKFGSFKMLFPGDMEKAGWLALLQRPEFVAELRGTTILFASHHGRESGFCEDIFDHFVPSAVVISDKPIEHETQEMVPDYRKVVRDAGVVVNGVTRPRHVLTTRRDGDIMFTLPSDAGGGFDVTLSPH